MLYIAFILSFALSAQAQTKPVAQPTPDTKQDKVSGIVVFPESSFTLSAPKNWVLDNESGTEQGLPAVFYPQGSSWANGKAVMYANIWVKQNPAEETLAKVIAADEKAFKERSANLKVTDAEALPTAKSGQKATVKYFTGDSFGNYEAIAYIDKGKTVTMIVLTSQTKEDFEKSLPAFKELVGSYSFLTDKIKVEK